jgi:hypothetical protein
MFLLNHGATAMSLFPLKFLSDSNFPPFDRVAIYFLTFFTLVTIDVWIYIVAMNQDKKYNHTSGVLYGDDDGNILARQVVEVTQMVSIPCAKALAFFNHHHMWMFHCHAVHCATS